MYSMETLTLHSCIYRSHIVIKIQKCTAVYSRTWKQAVAL